jgi:ABC-type oligopeptide transport system substrate-binding subunit
MPFVDRIEFYSRAGEHSRFNKLLQGYYDDGGIIKESFDAVVQATGCRRRCRRGHAPSTRRWSRASATSASTWRTRCRAQQPASAAASCRQAMSVAIDSSQYLELFLNVAACPPRRCCHPASSATTRTTRTPFASTISPARADVGRRRLPQRHRPGHQHSALLSFDTSATTAAANLQFEYLAAAWRQLGLDIEINATTYNQFQDKVRRGAYQIFIWGWLADFPDPENFLFLLRPECSAPRAAAPTRPNFCNAEYDRLYLR